MNDLTVGKEGNRILQFAIPLLLGNIFQQLYLIVDSIIVGKVLGTNALTAIGNCFPVIFTLVSLIIGIAIGGTVVISQYYGAKQVENVRKAANTLFIFLFFASLVLTIAGILFSAEILRLMNIPEVAFDMANNYMQVYLSGLVVFFGFNGISAVLRGLGDSKTPLYLMIAATMLNIILDLLFVVKYGWGIKGAAWATVISQGLVFFASIIYINKKHQVIKISLKNLNFDKKIFIKTLQIGIPSGLQTTFVAIGMMVLMGIVNQFGNFVAAAYSAAHRVGMLAIMPAMNFGTALSTFVGQNIGANKMKRIKNGLRSTLIMSSITCIFISIGIILFGSNLMALFTNNNEVIKVGKDYLVIVSSFYIIFNIMLVINGLLRGAGDTIIPMFISIFSLWLIRLPLAVFLSGKFEESGIWWSIPIAWTLGTIISYIYFLSGKWKKKTVVAMGVT